MNMRSWCKFLWRNLLWKTINIGKVFKKKQKIKIKQQCWRKSLYLTLKFATTLNRIAGANLKKARPPVLTDPSVKRSTTVWQEINRGNVTKRKTFSALLIIAVHVHKIWARDFKGDLTGKKSCCHQTTKHRESNLFLTCSCIKLSNVPSVPLKSYSEKPCGCMSINEKVIHPQMIPFWQHSQILHKGIYNFHQLIWSIQKVKTKTHSNTPAPHLCNLRKKCETEKLRLKQSKK